VDRCEARLPHCRAIVPATVQTSRAVQHVTRKEHERKRTMGRKTIAHVTDAHLGQKVLLGCGTEQDKMSYRNEPEEHKDNLKAVLDDVANRGVSELVFGGDIGTKETNEPFFALVKKYGFKLRMVLGNHDSFSEVSKHYSTDHVGDRNELIYSHEDNYLKYIYLDSSSNTLSGGQLCWLKQELTGDKNVLLFVHHPILEIDAPLDKSSAALRGRERARTLLHDSKTPTSIFCGHYHMIDETVDGNASQFLTPAVSYQIDKRSETISIDRRVFGYRLIEIDRADIRSDIVMLSK
jgi:3',5'-cyclic-AMP phosphodiesterase